MYTIEIRKVNGNESEFVVGCEYFKQSEAVQMFEQIQKRYYVTPVYGDGDFLVDLYFDEELMDTFVTNEQFANEIDQQCFQ